ncbi:hypothetical protein ACHMXB_22635 (plasmid) [Arthrobacter sp. UC242_113]|uniref:hypothetical protein n=1 Tax=Arthrobacter sp. UC242_113 TaxID=3374550 RepID=UPI0037581D1A
MSDSTTRILDMARRRATARDAQRITSLQSPAVAEALGVAIAATLQNAAAEIVVVWDQIETGVLGHVVARELQTDLIYAYSVEGSLGFSAELFPGSRAVLVSYDWTESHGLDAIIRFTQSSGAAVTAISSVLETAEARMHPKITTHALSSPLP